ncbi:MAG: TolC family protein [Desulfosalsimonas sp.]|uniref:TolC family protein n=1 Tax=Desulfosalsimonas sp. TaxID=3073848 RepID=UPI003970CDB5
MNRISGIVLAAIALLLMGCGSAPKYTASSIRAEYEHISGAPANQAPTEKTPRTQSPDASDIDPALPLTLPQVIEITLSNNPNLQQAVYRIDQARAMKDLADTAFWPMLGFYTEYTQGDAPSAYLFKTIDQRKLPPDLNFNDPGWFENYETGIQARMNLFNGGKDYLELRMAEQAVKISDLDRQAVVNDLTAQVIAAFYDVLAAKEFIDIAAESVASVSEQLRVIRVQYDGGGALKSDVLSLQVRLARAEERLVETRNRFKLAKAALANLMGVDPAGFSQKRNILSGTSESAIQVPDEYEDGIIQALSRRPELEKVRKQLIKSRMGLDAAKTNYLPSVDLMGKYYVDDPEMDYNRDRENWTAGVVFNWDLFTGFSTKARVNKADAMVKEMLAADRQATLGVKLDVKNAYLNRKAAEARYEVAASSVESAEESYRLVKEHYNGGAVTITRYLEAELDRNRARIRSTAAFYDKIKANADLARAIGKWAGRNPQPTER